jgi:hypothetical protein
MGEFAEGHGGILEQETEARRAVREIG